MHRAIPSFARFLGVFLLFAAATAVFFWEWLPHLPSALIGPPEDNMQDFWNTWYGAFARDPSRFFFTNLIRFPEGTPLVYHSFAYPQVFAVTLISKVFGLNASSLILQQNLSLLISFHWPAPAPSTWCGISPAIMPAHCLAALSSPSTHRTLSR